MIFSTFICETSATVIEGFIVDLHSDMKLNRVSCKYGILMYKNYRIIKTVLGQIQGVLDIAAHGQQFSSDKHSIWIPHMLQSGHSNSLEDNECQAPTTPPNSTSQQISLIDDPKLSSSALCFHLTRNGPKN